MASSSVLQQPIKPVLQSTHRPSHCNSVDSFLLLSPPAVFSRIKCQSTATKTAVLPFHKKLPVSVSAIRLPYSLLYAMGRFLLYTFKSWYSKIPTSTARGSFANAEFSARSHEVLFFTRLFLQLQDTEYVNNETAWLQQSRAGRSSPFRKD